MGNILDGQRRKVWNMSSYDTDDTTTATTTTKERLSDTGVGSGKLPPVDSLRYIIENQNLKHLEREYPGVVNDISQIYANLEPNGKEYMLAHLAIEDIVNDYEVAQGFFADTAQALAERDAVRLHAALNISRAKGHAERQALNELRQIVHTTNGQEQANSKKRRLLAMIGIR
jgi:hypothetical protein